ncbi:MAG: hypothetical protein LC101_06095 [Flavobacteriales bacterium]|nr:hypothetical protein [Flavobacteriales bacterium]
MPVSRIQELSKDIPAQSTIELHPPNDYYGIATNIKHYADFPIDYAIKASIEHGVYYADYYWQADIAAPLPAVFCPSVHRQQILRRVTNKPVYPIGPSIAYAEGVLSIDTVEKKLREEGPTLLVFPAHSTHWIDVNFSIDRFCTNLKKYKKDFKTIKICLYWKDVLRGSHQQYKEAGFDCVTAGHIFDPYFLNRLRSIIETSTHTMSNSIGTHVGYCVFLGKPHFLVREETTYNMAEMVKHEATQRLLKYETSPEQLQFFNIFGKWQDSITTEQKELVDLYWGISQIKSPSEMHRIIIEVETLYLRPHTIGT